MRLHYAPTSPYVRKVMVLIAEAGISGIETVAVSGTPTAPDPRGVEGNPLGKIPALERDDGPTLYDSRVICRFLDAGAGAGGGAGFYPAAPRLWDTLTVEATADGIMDAALLMVYESRIRPEEKHHTPWVEGQWSKIARALDVLETRWIDHLGGALDMGQIATACALGYLDLRHAVRDWRKDHGKLAQWEAAFAARPSMRATVPQG